MQATPRKEFRIPLLETLVEMDGRGESLEVYNGVEAKMKSRLMPGDYEKLSSEKIRWKDAVLRARGELKNEGFIRSDSPRGVCEISDEGRAYLEKASFLRK